MLRHSERFPPEDRVRYFLLPVVAISLIACGGGAPAAPAPNLTATTPEGAVRLFFQAVADSNVAEMSRLWGSSGGPASVTGKPEDYLRRLEVTQLFLRNSPYRVTAATPTQSDRDRQQVQVELDRTDIDGKRCARTMAVVVVNAGKHGWIVEAMDQNQAGTPGRSCTGGATSIQGQ